SVELGLHRPGYVRDQPCVGVSINCCDHPRQRCARKMSWNEIHWSRQAQGFQNGFHSCVAQSCLGHQNFQLVRVSEDERTSQLSGSFLPNPAFQGLRESEEIGVALDPAPDCQSDPPARNQDPAHFSQSSYPIREKLKALMAE